ncbi:MAG: U32 family peptidase [Actinomycetota bacterium]|nr:U32 family peptidase [Actinomycetota bacterium]
MEIAIGPLPTNWGKEKILDYYRKVAAHPAINRAYVGEIACTKRDILDPELFIEIQDSLKKAGKEVILSTLVLPTNEEDLNKSRALMAKAHEIEVNNMGIFNVWLKEFREKSLTLGPFFNVYNPQSARFLLKYKIRRILFPVDISMNTMEKMCQEIDIPFEVVVYGNFPIAFSWRCYTARAFGKLRRDCGFKCYEVKNLPQATLEDEPLFMMNGPAVYNAKTYCLISHLKRFRGMGVAGIRIETIPENVVGVADIFKAVIDGEISPTQAEKKLASLSAYRLDTCYFTGREKRLICSTS